ncbi:MAG TPA: hypothetical protein VF838_13185 [Trebonia sp.]
MLADAPVAAPVLAQPSSPAPAGKARRADLGLSPGDLTSVKAKVAAGCQVLGLLAGDHGDRPSATWTGWRACGSPS